MLFTPGDGEETVSSVKVQELKARVDRANYVVDADAVAEALLRRHAARRFLKLPATGDARSRAGRGEPHRG